MNEEWIKYGARKKYSKLIAEPPNNIKGWDIAIYEIQNYLQLHT